MGPPAVDLAAGHVRRGAQGDPSRWGYNVGTFMARTDVAGLSLLDTFTQWYVLNLCYSDNSLRLLIPSSLEATLSTRTTYPPSFG